MAKKRKHTTKRRTSRRRMGATKGGLVGTLEKLGGLVLGAVAGTVIQRQLTSVNAKLISLGEMALGAYGMNHSNSIIQGAGWGLAGAGATGFVHEIGIIHGVEDMMNGVSSDQQMWREANYQPNVAGISNHTYVAGISNYDRMSGFPYSEDPYNAGTIGGIGAVGG